MLKYEVYILSLFPPGPVSKDGDSDADDDEWPSLERAAALEKAEYCEEISVNPEDEKAIEMFMNKNPPMR